ncbi:NAD(P)-binding protein [Lepidopterella palustris CBS 459.81]|uniref:NAD(P)-binding protein n=1 Tax=Lepidopterella palustris CBS 459.81 TaxID=1314670 RepID=A0A8E2ECV8_9PEZI|nr:NAD(P)-binding protein [Lepidopterella palustris CBS 459.81]
MATPIQVDETTLKSLGGKTILITGASSGIGLETAELFYALGSNVVFVGGRKQPSTKISLVDNPRTLVCNCDISSWDSILSVFKAAISKFGTIDIVCPNAGVDEPRNQYFDLKVDEAGEPQPLDLRVVDVDFKGTAYTIALGIHYLRKSGKGGSIIIVSSMAGYHAVPLLPNYCASKHAAVGLLRALTPRGKPENIAISLVAPHITYTPGTFPGKYKPGRAEYEKIRDELKAVGIRLSSSRTCALAAAYLAEGGLEMAGKGLVVENDEINDLETAWHEARPSWFVKKSENEQASKVFSSMRFGTA